MFLLLISTLCIASVSSASNNYVIMQGFVQGLRKDPKSDTGCYLLITQTVSTYSLFIDNPFTFNNTDAILHYFQDYLNDFTESVNICGIEPLANNIVALLNPTAFKKYQLYLGTKYSQLIKLYGEFTQAQTDKNYSDEGYYLGKMFSIAFRYTI